MSKTAEDIREFKKQDKQYHEEKHTIVSYDRRITKKYQLEHKYYTVNKWIEKMIDEKTSLVLDFGCGTGSVTLQLLEKGIKTISCDASLGMLNELQRKAGARGLKCICKVADVENLPFKNDTFEALVCTGVLHHLPDIKKAVKEQLRVIKKGGLLFIAEPTSNRSWVSCIYWKMVDIVKAIFRLLRKPRLETQERPLDKEDINEILHVLKNEATMFSVTYLIYWPIVAGYFPEFLAYPFIRFLNKINKSSYKGDSVIIEVKK